MEMKSTRVQTFYIQIVSHVQSNVSLFYGQVLLNRSRVPRSSIMVNTGARISIRRIRTPPLWHTRDMRINRRFLITDTCSTTNKNVACFRCRYGIVFDTKHVQIYISQLCIVLCVVGNDRFSGKDKSLSGHILSRNKEFRAN